MFHKMFYLLQVTIFYTPPQFQLNGTNYDSLSLYMITLKPLKRFKHYKLAYFIFLLPRNHTL